jgi:hypothetical protein
VVRPQRRLRETRCRVATTCSRPNGRRSILLPRAEGCLLHVASMVVRRCSSITHLLLRVSVPPIGEETVQSVSMRPPAAMSGNGCEYQLPDVDASAAAMLAADATPLVYAVLFISAFKFVCSHESIAIFHCSHPPILALQRRERSPCWSVSVHLTRPASCICSTSLYMHDRKLTCAVHPNGAVCMIPWPSSVATPAAPSTISLKEHRTLHP